MTGPVDFAELARAASRPAAVTGPRDLPLAREAAILSMEFIWVCLFVMWRKMAHSPFAPLSFIAIASLMRSFPSSFSQTLRASSVYGRDK